MLSRCWAFHSPEPCHLPFGKLVDGYLKLAEHFVVGKISQHILGHKLVLQAVVDKVVGLYALVEQCLNLVYHTLVYALPQPVGYPLATFLAVYIYSYNKRVDRFLSTARSRNKSVSSPSDLPSSRCRSSGFCGTGDNS